MVAQSTGRLHTRIHTGYRVQPLQEVKPPQWPLKMRLMNKCSSNFFSNWTGRETQKSQQLGYGRTDRSGLSEIQCVLDKYAMVGPVFQVILVNSISKLVKSSLFIHIVTTSQRASVNTGWETSDAYDVVQFNNLNCRVSECLEVPMHKLKKIL